MLYVLLVVLWYADGTHFAVANAYPTEAQCLKAEDSAVFGIQRGAIEGVSSVAAFCIPSSNPVTEKAA